MTIYAELVPHPADLLAATALVAVIAVAVVLIDRAWRRSK